MKIQPLDPKYSKVLKRIQENIPKELIKNITHEEDLAPTVIIVAKKALEDPEVDEAIKAKLRIVLDTKILEKKIDVENPEVTQKINDYIEDEIAKAVIRGELPKSDNKDLAKRIKRLIKAKNGKTSTSN